jgi:hypothetical protein
VAIPGFRSNTRTLGGVVQAGIGARPGERLLRDFENALTIPLRVRAAFGRPMGKISQSSSSISKKLVTGDSVR